MGTRTKPLRIACVLLVAVTAAWALLTIASASETDSSWSDAEYVEWIGSPSIITTVNYVNAALVTALAAVFFAFLSTATFQVAPVAVIVGAPFIPVYAAMNLIVYTSQITLVPRLAQATQAGSASFPVVVQLMQLSPQHTIVSTLNLLAYAALAVPSIALGLGAMRRGARLTVSGVLLAASGAFSIVGFLGALVGSPLLEVGVLAGGGVFLVALVWFLFDLAHLDGVARGDG